MRVFTRFLPVLSLVLLGACASVTDLQDPPVPLGRFLLGHKVVVAENPQVAPLSRKASEEEWKANLTTAIEERFGRYQGDRYYHIAIKVEGYMLAPPGVPVVASPKSVLIVGVTVWDDAKGEKLNAKPKILTVFESLSGENVVGSGLTKTREVQMRELSRNTAKLIQDWLVENRGWFEG